MKADPTIIISVLVFVFLETGILVLYLNKQNAPVRTTVLQWIALAIFIPFIFLLSYLDKIDSNVTSTLLGGFAGYVFGKVGLSEEWTNTRQG